MAIKDFRARRARTSKIIGSGSETSGTPSLIIHSASAASDYDGGTTPIAAVMLEAVGKDAEVFLSGNILNKVRWTTDPAPADRREGGVTIVGGDLVVSGGLYDGGGTLYEHDVDWTDGGGKLKTTSSVSIDGDDKYVDELLISTYPTRPNMADAFFYVSGSKNSRGTSFRGTSVFGGDLVVSGTLYAEKQIIEVDGDVTGALHVSGGLFVSKSAEIAGFRTVGEYPGTALYLPYTTRDDHPGKPIVIAIGGETKPSVLRQVEDAVTTYKDFHVLTEQDLWLTGGRDVYIKSGDSPPYFGINDIFMSGNVKASHAGGTQPVLTLDDRGVQITGPMFEISGSDGNAWARLTGRNVLGQDLQMGWGVLDVEGGPPQVYAGNTAWFGGLNDDTRTEIRSNNLGRITVTPGSSTVRSTAQVLILSGGAKVDSHEMLYADMNFFVSGGIGYKDGTRTGVSVFGGDVVISGTLHGGSPLLIGTDTRLSGTYGSAQYLNFGGPQPAGTPDPDGSTGYGFRYDGASNLQFKNPAGAWTNIGGGGGGGGGAADVGWFGPAAAEITTTGSVGFGTTLEAHTISTSAKIRFMSDGVAIFNATGLASGDFRVESDDSPGTILVDAGTNQIALQANGTTAAAVYGLNAGTSAMPTDMNLWISGAVDAHGVVDKYGVAGFGGDVVMSGTLYVSGGLLANANVFEKGLMINRSRGHSTGNGLVVQAGEGLGISKEILVCQPGLPAADGAGAICHILSGGLNTADSPNPYYWRDTGFFVSGSRGAKNSNSGRGTAVFGGDTVVSGVLWLGESEAQSTPGGGKEAFMYVKDSNAGNLIISASNDIYVYPGPKPLAGTSADFVITGTAHTSLQIHSAPTVDGNTAIKFSVDAGGSTAWAIGVDDGDGDKFKINGGVIDGSDQVVFKEGPSGMAATDVALGLGAADPTFRLQVNSDDATSTICISETETSVFGSILRFEKSRGGAVASREDEAGQIIFHPCDTAGFFQNQAAAIKCFVDGPIGAANAPGRLEFATTPHANSMAAAQTRLYISGSGMMLFNSGTNRGPAPGDGGTSPDESTYLDTIHFFSGGIGYKDNSLPSNEQKQGVNCFGGDVHISGNLSVDGTSPGGGGGLWTDGTAFIYPTDTADHIVLGSSTLVNADILLGADGTADFNKQQTLTGDFTISTQNELTAFYVDAELNFLSIHDNTVPAAEVMFNISGSQGGRIHPVLPSGVSAFGGDLVVSGAIYGGEWPIDHPSYIGGLKNAPLQFGTWLSTMGEDVGFHYAGIPGGKDLSTQGVAVFDSDLVVSGATHIKGAYSFNGITGCALILDNNAGTSKIVWDSPPTAPGHGAPDAMIYESTGDLYLSASSDVFLNATQGGEVVCNTLGNNIDFRVESSVFDSMMFVAGGLNQVWLGKETNATPMPNVGMDITTLISGSRGSIDGTIGGTTLVAGDLIVSGAIYEEQYIVTSFRTTVDSVGSADEYAVFLGDNYPNPNYDPGTSYVFPSQGCILDDGDGTLPSGEGGYLTVIDPPPAKRGMLLAFSLVLDSGSDTDCQITVRVGDGSKGISGGLLWQSQVSVRTNFKTTHSFQLFCPPFNNATVYPNEKAVVITVNSNSLATVKVNMGSTCTFRSIT